MNDLISIIVPVYNVEQYLDRCVKSLLQQTYKNLEIILVDDGSPDRCGQMCDNYAKLDSRVLVIHKENGGLSDARNTGLCSASGKYIGFIDSDDWVAPDMFEVLYNGLIGNNADISICGYYKVQDNVVYSKYIENAVVYSKQEALQELLLDNKIENYAWNKLYKSSLFTDDIKYPIDKHFEDVGTTYKLFMNAETIVVLPEIKYFYFRHPNSIVGSWKAESLIDYIWCLEQRFYDTKEIYPEFYNLHFKKYWKVFSSMLGLLKKEPIEKQGAIIKKLEIFVFPFARKHREDIIQYNALGETDRKNFDLALTNIRKFFEIHPVKDFVHKLYQKVKWRIKEKSVFSSYFRKKDFKNHRLYPLLQAPRTAPLLIIMCGADYDNLGDHAISYAQNIWLQENFEYSEIIEVYSPECQRYLLQMKRYIKNEDVILLQGGGNMGDLYPWFERERRSIIETFPNNRIVLFPQSVYFKNETELQKSQQVYGRHKELFLIARESLSYQFLCENFQNNNVLLAPDIVMSLSLSLPTGSRDGVLLCFRDDQESTLSKAFILNIRKICKKTFTKIALTDTVTNANISPSLRENALFEKWNEFAGAKLIITNRLHGMIFAAITNTPCIALDNSTHKIKYSYTWLENLNYIEFVDRIEDIEKAINKLTQIVPCGFEAFSRRSDFDTLYKVIAKKI